MPIEQLLALYGYGDRGRGGGTEGGGDVEGNGESAEGRGPEETAEEEMEEDEEEEDDDDESMESTSSSSIVTPADVKVEAAPEESSLQPGEDPPAAVVPVPKVKTEAKPRSELHLLYANEEGIGSGARLLRSAGAAGNTASDEEGDEEDDVDYAPGEDEWRKVLSNIILVTSSSSQYNLWYFFSLRPS